MAKIKLKSASLSSDPEVKAPRFYFMPYSKGMTVTNNEEEIDFVTDGKSLYVAFQNGQVQLNGDEIGANSQYLLKIVSQGEKGEKGNPGIDGAAGVVPEIGAEYIDIGDEKKLALTVGGKRKAMTGDLTPPVYVPTLVNDRYLTWEWNGDEPATIDLMKLRPVNERPILLRTNSDNTKLDAEVSGPANFIQWKYEGDEHWTNLISIQELMNLAFAGMCTWEAADGKWHFGYKEVVKATYDSTKSGRRIINRVELGQILFDAGEIPLQDYGIEIEMIEAQLEELKNSVQSISIDGGKKLTPDKDGNVNLDLSDYAKKSDIPDTIDDYVKGIKVNGGTTKYPDSNTGIVNLDIQTGGGADTSDCVKSVTINGERKTPVNGNVSFNITVGDSSVFDVKIEQDGHLWKTLDGINWIDVGAVNTGGSVNPTDLTQLKLRVGDPSDESKRNHLFVSYDNGQTWIDAGEFLDTDTQYELQGYATIQMLQDLYYQKSVLYTKTEIDNMLSGADVDLTSYRTFTIYQRSASNNESDIHLPNDNIVAVWDVSNGVLDLPSDYTDWTNHPENATPQKPYLWMASATFESKQGSRISPWDGPFCLTGENGQEGADGKSIEFIYHLGPIGVGGAKPTAPSINYTKSKKGSSTNNRTKAWWATAESTDSCPGDGDNGYWTDNPQGIDDSQNSKVEWASIRKSHYDYENKVTVWEDFCEPFIWAMWGEDGMDGDGVQYIFLATSNPISVAQYPPIHLRDIYNDVNGNDVSQEENDNNIDYDHPKPSYENYDTREYIPNGWTDDPSDVDAQQPYEYVSIRRFNGSTGHWESYSVPKMWRMYKVEYHTSADVVNNYHPYTEFAFTRTDEDLTGYTVTGGQAYANPLEGIVTKNAQNQVVHDIIWTDGVPSNSTEQIWVITALIGDEDQQQTATWTGPWKLGDRAGIQIEYSKDEKAEAVYLDPTLWNENNLTLNDFEGTDEQREALWEQEVLNDYGVWSDDVVDPIFMATTVLVNGVWTDWVVSRIKGETGQTGSTGPQGRNGSPGTDGEGVEYVYYRTDSESHVPGAHATRGTYDSESSSNRQETSENSDRDGFFPKAVANGFTLDDGVYWHDHPQGVSLQYPCEYVAIRHSSPTVTQDGTDANGQPIYVKHKNWSVFNVALWSKFGENGKDGDGIEYVFFALTPEQHEFVQAGMTYNNVEYSGKLPVDNSAISGVHGNPAEQEFWPNSAPILNNSDVVRAQDDNPGMTEQKPYVYCSQRKYSGLSSSWGPFGPASLWLAGSEATYTYADVNFNEDSTPVLVNASNMQPVEKSTGTAMNSVAFYVGTRKLTYKKVEVKINDVWTNFQTVSETSGGTSSYNIVTTPLTIYSYDGKTVVLDNFGSYTTDSGLQALNVKLVFTGGYVFNDPIEIPVRVTSFETYADDSYYSAEGVLKFIPITTNFTLDVHADGIIKKSNADSTDYTNTSNIISIFRTSLDKNQIDVQFNGTESFPTDYTNWTVKVFFDGVQTYSIPFGTIYKSWRDNYHNDLDDGISLEKYYDPSGAVVNSYSGLPVSLHIQKTFVKDQHSDHHYQSDYIGLQLDMNSLPLLVDNIKFALYDNSTLVDEEIIPIFYNGKNGTNGNSTEHLGYITSDYELDNTEWPQNDTSVPDDEPASEEEDDGSKGPSKAPTRGGETQQQGPEIEIDENGQVHITPGDDGNVKIDDGSGNYDVVDINTGTIYRYELIKVTTYDANNNPSVKIVANKVETIEAPSYYLIKDVHYYDDINGDPLTVNKKIYALMVDNGQLVIRGVADNNPNQSGEETEP